ncbi:MAG: DNA recombination protein RmuC [Dehalococcoidia bacterium]
MLPAIILLFLVLVFGVVLALLVLQFRSPNTGAGLSTALQVVSEKLSQLEVLPKTMVGVQVELRGLTERISTVERSQDELERRLQSITTNLAATSSTADNLSTTARAIHADLQRAQEGLLELQTQSRAWHDVERQTAESVKRLEMVIAGTQSKGAAGENVLEAVFSKLPPEWQVREFRVGNKAVEFGLRLPNNLVLPIDSKWTATTLIEQFAASNDTDQQRRIKIQIEQIVLTKVREVRKYIDPSITTGFAVAVVPDSVYDLCSAIHVLSFESSVVLVSYSMFVPYLLLVFQTVLRTAQHIDVEKLAGYVQSVEDNVKAIQEELEGRFARAITMLNNSRNDMSSHVSRVSAGLVSLQIGSETHPMSDAYKALEPVGD